MSFTGEDISLEMKYKCQAYIFDVHLNLVISSCRGPPRIPEPIIPHGLPPEHVPRVPAVRPGMGGPPHPRPPMKVPNYVPASIGGMHAVAPRPAIPRMPPVPTLVGAPLPHRPPFGPPMFDPLHHPSDIPRSLTPPMSEREFYKIQKKLKSR